MMTDTKRVNLFTVAGIAALAYVVTTLAHEGLGHGGACLAVHGKAMAWGAYYFECETKGLADWAGRAVNAAGNTVNLILALIFATILKADLANPRRHGSWTVFLWLMFTINAYTWAGYFLFSGVAGIGDWGTHDDAVLHDVPNAWLWRAVMAIVGMGLYLWLVRVSAGLLARIVGGDRMDLARKLSWTAYLTGGIVAILIGLLNPVGFMIVLISSMASSLGGTSGLFWGMRLMKRDTKGVDFDLGLNVVWIGLGVVAAVAYAFLLGPTITF